LRPDVVIHIVDDEEAVRHSLAFLLTTAGYAVRVHPSATEFLAIAPNLDLACLVTDLKMPDINGVDLLRRMRAANVAIPSIVITGHGDVPMAVQAMKAGALDFIEKPFDDQVLIDAIDRAIASVEKSSSGADNGSAVRLRFDQLTEREKQVMKGIVAGQANKTIAYDLDISPRTVEVHRANVMAKMQAKSLPDLVRMVLSADLPY
jgi:two-component system response regulator FixJ